jgi:RNA recognition motif-containing protein
LYVGNLPYKVSENDIQNWFAEAGFQVDSVTVVRDKFSGEPRGFGFVEINKPEDAEMAIRACNGKECMGRALVVNEARPMSPGGGGGGGGGRPRGERRRP